jgi:hypothetical protein
MTTQNIETDTVGLKKLKFADDRTTSFVAKALRVAWKAIPPAPGKNGPTDDVYWHLVKTRELDDNEVQQNLNNDMTADTRWRKAVYWTWNNVFDDLMEFVSIAAPEIGHFHHPNESFIPLTEQ